MLWWFFTYTFTTSFCFQAYEKGVALFKWPNVFDIWNTYLTKFIDRYVRLLLSLDVYLSSYDYLNVFDCNVFREARSWSAQEIFLNNVSMVVHQSLQNVRTSRKATIIKTD